MRFFNRKKNAIKVSPELLFWGFWIILSLFPWGWSIYGDPYFWGPKFDTIEVVFPVLALLSLAVFCLSFVYKGLQMIPLKKLFWIGAFGIFNILIGYFVGDIWLTSSMMLLWGIGGLSFFVADFYQVREGSKIALLAGITGVFTLWHWGAPSLGFDIELLYFLIIMGAALSIRYGYEKTVYWFFVAWALFLMDFVLLFFVGLVTILTAFFYRKKLMLVAGLAMALLGAGYSLTELARFWEIGIPESWVLGHGDGSFEVFEFESHEASRALGWEIILWEKGVLGVVLFLIFLALPTLKSPDKLWWWWMMVLSVGMVPALVTTEQGILLFCAFIGAQGGLQEKGN